MGYLTGVEHAWAEFSKINLSEAAKRAGGVYDDESRIFSLSCFGLPFSISKERREIWSDSPAGAYLLGIKDYFFDLAILWYLLDCQNVGLSGNLIKPSDVPGGQIFLQGTHVLPLEQIGLKYSGQKELFMAVSAKYGGDQAEFGDVAVKLYPFPRVPVYLILWFGDENFPASGQLLLDSTCISHLSTDVLWAVSMVCCLIFLD